MKTTKRILSILLSGLMLLSMLSIGVFAAGTQDDPIDAATKWFGYGVDTYLLNPTITAGATDGMWYTLTAENEGVLFLEHSYKNVDYTIYITLNGVTYEGGCVNGEPYNRPIVTAPIKTGDVATIQVVTKGAAAGTVYASMNVIAGDVDNPIKVKSNGLRVVVGAGKTVYFQDDSLNAIYATMGLLVQGHVADTTFYTVAKNSESGAVITKPFTDSDTDGVLEVKLGGSLGGAGAPAVKPGWAIENNSNEDQWYTLTIVDAAHECNWDDDTDADCNTCGAIREIVQPCAHTYQYACSKVCTLCGEIREASCETDGCHSVADVDFHERCYHCRYCGVPMYSEVEAHYDDNGDNICDFCTARMEVDVPTVTLGGNSVSSDVHGLAVYYNVQVTGMAVNGSTAIYDNAQVTLDGQNYQLKTMGVIASNQHNPANGVYPTKENATANGQNGVIDIPALYLDPHAIQPDQISFAFRIIHIPEYAKDASVLFVPYLVIETNGEEQVLYLTDCASYASYNSVLA